MWEAQMRLARLLGESQIGFQSHVRVSTFGCPYRQPKIALSGHNSYDRKLPLIKYGRSLALSLSLCVLSTVALPKIDTCPGPPAFITNDNEKKIATLINQSYRDTYSYFSNFKKKKKKKRPF